MELVQFEFVQSLTLDDAYCRMYKAGFDGTTLFKETYCKRNEGGFTAGNTSIQYHFANYIGSLNDLCLFPK